MRPILTVAFVISTCNGFCQQVTTSVKEWKSYPVPANKDTLSNYILQHDTDWTVVSVDNTIAAVNTRVKPAESLPFKIMASKKEQYKFSQEYTVIKVDDGYLIGFRRGEWGGNLYWFSNDGGNRYEISTDQVNQFIKQDNKIYAIEGLSHLGISAGRMISINKDNGKWKVKEFLKFDAEPEAIDIDSKKDFIIVTAKGLYSATVTAAIHPVVADAFWHRYLYPTSLIVQNDIVYIGMRKGIFKYDLKTKKQEWLMPGH
ncbi:hypothetical protein [Ferruginibacter sp. SUN106]|uniref:hypothetical protein n=1 Tax=Ferruginibacter sp. SUN106 TaxID=2978348 RepID=UPI003D36800D